MATVPSPGSAPSLDAPLGSLFKEKYSCLRTGMFFRVKDFPVRQVLSSTDDHDLRDGLRGSELLMFNLFASEVLAPLRAQLASELQGGAPKRRRASCGDPIESQGAPAELRSGPHAIDLNGRLGSCIAAPNSPQRRVPIRKVALNEDRALDKVVGLATAEALQRTRFPTDRLLGFEPACPRQEGQSPTVRFAKLSLQNNDLGSADLKHVLRMLQELFRAEALESGRVDVSLAHNNISSSCKECLPALERIVEDKRVLALDLRDNPVAHTTLEDGTLALFDLLKTAPQLTKLVWISWYALGDPNKAWESVFPSDERLLQRFGVTKRALSDLVAEAHRAYYARNP